MHYEQAPFSRPNHLSNSSPVGVASLYVVAVAMMESHEYTLRPAGAPSRVGIAAFLLGLFVLSKVKGGKAHSFAHYRCGVSEIGMCQAGEATMQKQRVFFILFLPTRKNSLKMYGK